MVTATHPTSLTQALRLTPRPYQYEAVAALLAATARGVQRPLLVLPTGTGKTIVFALLVQRRGGRSLILAHRDELIQQAVDKLRLVDPLAVNLCGRPCPQFLRQAAVEGVRPLTVWQTFLCHEPTHARLRSGDIRVTSGEQVCESNALLWRVRVEGKMRPDNLHIVGGPESLNTSRTEITPGSHVVRENFQGHWLWHIASRSYTMPSCCKALYFASESPGSLISLSLSHIADAGALSKA